MKKQFKILTLVVVMGSALLYSVGSYAATAGKCECSGSSPSVACTYSPKVFDPARFDAKISKANAIACTGTTGKKAVTCPIDKQAAVAKAGYKKAIGEASFSAKEAIKAISCLKKQAGKNYVAPANSNSNNNNSANGNQETR